MSPGVDVYITLHARKTLEMRQPDDDSTMTDDVADGGGADGEGGVRRKEPVVGGRTAVGPDLVGVPRRAARDIAERILDRVIQLSPDGVSIRKEIEKDYLIGVAEPK